MPPHDHVTSSNLGGVDRFASEQRRVEKPWGYELIFVVTDAYAGKLLVVKAGESLSLQFHKLKDEAWYILDGRCERGTQALRRRHRRPRLRRPPRARAGAPGRRRDVARRNSTLRPRLGAAQARASPRRLTERTPWQPPSVTT